MKNSTRGYGQRIRITGTRGRQWTFTRGFSDSATTRGVQWFVRIVTLMVLCFVIVYAVGALIWVAL